MNWGIAETSPEIEKIKSESADYLSGLNSCGVIDWNTYNYAFDFYEDLLIKAYEQGKKDAQPEPCDDPRADVYYLAEKIGIHRLYALVVALRGESEPQEDAVSRQAVIDTARKVSSIFEGEYDTRTPYGVILDVQDAVSKLPSVTPKLPNIDFLMPESELVFYNNDHGFCINTQDVLEHIERYVQWER